MPLPEYRLHMEESFSALESMYTIYASATADFPVACREKCSDCCTCNVTLTSLEAAYLLTRLDDAGRRELKRCLEKAPAGQRFRPKMTTNGFAKACMEGREVEDEENDPAWGYCPLLLDGRCTVYPVRPFGCRNMMSETACAEAGYARMPPLALTLNNIFLQYIEQLDIGGFTGNLADVLGCYLDRAEKGEGAYLSLENIKDSGTTGIFIRNHRIPALMIPPDHRTAAAPVLNEIAKIPQG